MLLRQSFIVCGEGRPMAAAKQSFFFNDTATTEIYTLSLHDALPTWRTRRSAACAPCHAVLLARLHASLSIGARSEEHTSELQSRPHLVCRLLLEKKKKMPLTPIPNNKPSKTSQ